MKKAILVVLITFIAFSWGFAGGRQEPDDRIPLSFYAWWAGGEREFGNALIAEFERQHPQYRVEAFIGVPDYNSLINTLVAAGQTPDVFQLGEGDVNQWGEAGTLADLNPYFRRRGIDPLEFYIESYLFKTANGLWGLGTGPATIALYYNKDLLRQAGVTPPSSDPSRPWRWEQFVDAAIRTTRDSAGRTPSDPGFNINNVAQWGTVMPAVWVVRNGVLHTAGATMINETGTGFGLTSPGAMRALQAIRDLHAVHRVAPPFEAFSTPLFANNNRPVMLMNDQIAMLIDGSWTLSIYMNAGFDVGVANIPTFAADGSAANHTWAAGMVMKAGGSEDAFNLLQWTMDYNNWPTTGSNYNVALGGMVPSTRSTYTNPALRSAWERAIPPQGVNIAEIAAHSNTVQARQVIVQNWSELSSHVNPGLERFLIGELTLQAALNEIERNLSGLYRGNW